MWEASQRALPEFSQQTKSPGPTILMPSIFLQGTRLNKLMSVNVIIRYISHLFHLILSFSDKADNVQTGFVALSRSDDRTRNRIQVSSPPPYPPSSALSTHHHASKIVEFFTALCFHSLVSKSKEIKEHSSRQVT